MKLWLTEKTDEAVDAQGRYYRRSHFGHWERASYTRRDDGVEVFLRPRPRAWWWTKCSPYFRENAVKL